MLKNDKRNFPMKVTVMATARVLDLIGLICWRCMAEYTRDETALKYVAVASYNLVFFFNLGSYFS